MVTPILSKIDSLRNFLSGYYGAYIAFGAFLVASAGAQATNTVAPITTITPVSPSLVSYAREFYIATNGSDSNSGANDHPFATLERARNAIREFRKQSGLPTGGFTVWVHGGTYFLDHTLTLDAEDSGSPGSPVVYRGVPGEKAIISGGRSISGFDRYQGQILKTDVGAQGLGGVYFRDLYLDGKRQVLARYPNCDSNDIVALGWAYVAGEPEPMYADFPTDDKHILHAKVADFHHWSHPEEAEVFIYPRYNWGNDIVTVKSVDEASRTITLSKNCSYPIRPGDRYFIQNLLEELDAPGEWYLDRRNSTLYFWPPTSLEGRSLVAPKLGNLIKLGQGASDITVRGLEIGCCSGNAVEMNSTTNCLIAGCIFRNIGDNNGNAILIKDGKGNGAAGNDISDIGRSGIVLKGGDPITLTPAGNYADNNHISHFGVYYKGGAGIDMSGCGDHASHNLIHDGPRFAILFWGTRHVVEYNHIHDVSLETEDTGAVYTGGRDWIGSRGSVIRYNYIHDVVGFAQINAGAPPKFPRSWKRWMFASGIYLDDNTGGVDVIGNVVVHCGGTGMSLHDSRDTVVIDNIFVDGVKSQVNFDGWTSTNNFWTRFHEGMVKGYDSIKDQPAWQGMRNIGISPDQSIQTNGLVMIGNQFYGNILSYQPPSQFLYHAKDVPFDRNSIDYNLVYHHGLPITNEVGYHITNVPKVDNTWQSWQKAGNDRHSLIADPLFVDPDKGNYTIRPQSPAYTLGFRQIPMEKIGPYADELRATWPINSTNVK